MKQRKIDCGSLHQVICFNDDNSLNSEIMYDSFGRKHGVAVFYGENNKIREKRFFVRDEPEGMQIIYHDNGQVQYTFYTHKGKPNGLVEKFDSDGKKICTLNFKNGLLEGACMRGYGAVKSIYKHGKLQKVEQQKTNKSYIIEMYKKGRVEVKCFWPNGNIREKYTPKNGMLLGKRRIYDTSGIFVGEYTYLQNKLVKCMILQDGKWIERPVSDYIEEKRRISKKKIQNLTTLMSHIKKRHERS